jgi:GMP synthase-like glutamine amidotransferase
VLERPGDEFVVFRAHARQLPSPAAAGSDFDALIIGGSHYSVYEDHEWIRELKAAVPEYLAAGARIVGCCFGCQVRWRAGRRRGQAGGGGGRAEVVR